MAGGSSKTKVVQPSPLPPIVGSLAGVAVMIIVGVLIHLWRRRQYKPKTKPPHPRATPRRTTPAVSERTNDGGSQARTPARLVGFADIPAPNNEIEIQEIPRSTVHHDTPVG
ncbi:hypothetical protein FB451DRAFT_1183028 [Mycena latifolia]|nr:hypothetical protein FB451DRAFT_1183028 [Mycena latifolia]